MSRLRRFFFRLTAYRVALWVGLFFTVFHLQRLGGDPDATPIIGRLEAIFYDLKFLERGERPPSGDVVVAAVDERAIEAIGRWPFARDDMGRLVGLLSEAGARAIVFDVAYVDQAFEGAEASAGRLRARVASFGPEAVESRQVSDALEQARARSREALAGVPEGQDAAPLLSVDAAIAEAIASLRGQEARWRSALAPLLEGEEGPDGVLARSIHESGRVVLGSFLLSESERAQLPDAEVQRGFEALAHMGLGSPELSPSALQLPEDAFLSGSRAPRSSPPLLRYAAPRAPLEALMEGPDGAPFVGFFNAQPDPDGVIRRTPLVFQTERPDGVPLYLPALGLAGLLRFLDAAPSSTRLWAALEDGALESIAILPDSLKDGGWATPRVGEFRVIPVDARGRLLVNYYGPFKAFPSVSLGDVWTGAVGTSALSGKLVLIGVTATGTFDQRVTPFDALVPGVATHAAALENMLHGEWLQRPWWAAPFEIAILLTLALLVGWVLSRLRVFTGVPVLLGAMAAYHLFDLMLFSRGYAVFSALPLVELLTIFVAQTVYRYSTEEREKAQIRRAFEFYLTKSVMEEMLHDPSKLKLGGEKKTLTVMFSDIRGFTSISEQLPPEQLAKLLNEYLTPMTQVVFRHGGTLDKFIGDAMMAVWGAPLPQADHALRCCRAAMDMLRELEALQARWRAEGRAYPPIEIGVGINSGPMVVGNMGADQRFDYTVLGDNVNLASRLEGTNKEYRSSVIISESTWALVRDEVSARRLGAVRVKGRQRPVDIYELLDDRPAEGALAEFIALFEEGVAHFQARRWGEARACFEEALARRPGDGPSLAYLDFCRDSEKNPPKEGWDGVYTLASK